MNNAFNSMVIRCLALAVVWLALTPALTAVAEGPDSKKIFQRDRLVAWCIVPFDALKRTPLQRAEMVDKLGMARVAYDWRAEHVPTFEAEIQEYKKHGIEFFAFWSWHDALEPLIAKHGIRPQIWLMLPGVGNKPDSEKVQAAAEALRPMVEKTAKLGLRLGLYNHGGWGGEPENLAAVCKYLREHQDAEHVGIVYNFHHGHEHIVRFPEAFAAVKPYLLCLNLNGMADLSSLVGNQNKILPIGKGVHEHDMIKEVLRQGYQGPIGILDHRSELDAELSLKQNLDGLDVLVNELK
ncbi:sugar phosphate isomerase/epimerase [Rubripirellula sp.]|jgi:hypothetical protein|nr:TIM barrel protein [Rubripirellula sp.]MDA9934533.1 sugar phosphate isomerase/epimerase [Rubripirellula sp.]MDB4634451.1 sugar phosphate isomerase/epimerase [Rubripirellula sp.]